MKRADGTTACERLSQIKSDDMFEVILQRIGPIAQPRNGKIRGRRNGLNLKDGVYFLTIESPRGNGSKKVIVQN